MFVKLEDTAVRSHKVAYPYTYAGQSELWREWNVDLKEFSDNSVDLANIKKVTIGIGDGTQSEQPLDGSRDTVYFDEIRLCPARCFNVDELDLSGDVNGDCMIDFMDFALMAAGWLNDGLSIGP